MSEPKHHICVVRSTRSCCSLRDPPNRTRNATGGHGFQGGRIGIDEHRSANSDGLSNPVSGYQLVAMYWVSQNS